MTPLQQDLHHFLLLVPLAAAETEGLHLSRAAELIGGEPKDVVSMVSRAFAVGTPDGSPDELIDLYVDEDRLHVSFPLAFDRPPRLTSEEIIALSLALGRVEELQTTHFGRVSSSLREKLRALATARAEKVSNSLDIEEEQAQHAFVEVVEQAISEKRSLIGSYYTATRDAFGERIVTPVKLWERAGKWYLISDGKMFRLDRFSELRFPKEGEKIVSESTTRKEPVEVELLFTEHCRRMPCRSTESLMRWCLQDNIGIASPDSVRNEVIAKLKNLKARYDD